MSRPRRRIQPRPPEPDRLRLSARRTRTLIGTVVALLVAAGVSVAVSGSFSLAALRGDGPSSSGTSAVAAGTNPTPSPAPSATPPAAPRRYPVVHGVTLRRAPEPTRRPNLAHLRARAEALLPSPDPMVPQAAFRVASFNVLGASHTGSGGRHSRFADAGTRMRWTASILRGFGISVAGFQEFQPVQHAVFHRVAPGWSVWPTAANGRRAMVNAVVWKSDEWLLVRTETIQIPYFGGRPRAMPYVLLEHRLSRQRIWFTSFHNPADARGPAQHWRDEAARRQIDLARRLSAQGTPVVFTGDMNDREEYFCPLTTSTGMHAANGGSRGASCEPPPQMDVDWILGSREVAFAGFASTDGGLVGRASDHPLVYADAEVSRPRG